MAKKKKVETMKVKVRRPFAQQVGPGIQPGAIITLDKATAENYIKSGIAEKPKAISLGEAVEAVMLAGGQIDVPDPKKSSALVDAIGKVVAKSEE